MWKRQKEINIASTHTGHSSLIVDNTSTVGRGRFCVSVVWFIHTDLKYCRLYGGGFQSIGPWGGRRGRVTGNGMAKAVFGAKREGRERRS